MKNKRSKTTIKPRGLNPAKQNLITKQKVESLLDIRRKDRLRMLWCMIISMSESDKVTFTQEAILDIAERIQSNFDEFNELVTKYGEDTADEKLNMRVNEVLGRDPLADEPSKPYELTTDGENDNETGN